jgi:hypothetical protein
VPTLTSVVAAPIAPAVTAEERSQIRSTAAVGNPSLLLTGGTDWRRMTGLPVVRSLVVASTGSPNPDRAVATGATGRWVPLIEERRARMSSGTAPTITAADTPITVYSSQGVSEAGRVCGAQVHQGHDGGHGRPEGGQPEHYAHGYQDAVGLIECVGMQPRSSRGVVVCHQQAVCQSLLFCEAIV